jgi:hypothetical protein
MVNYGADEIFKVGSTDVQDEDIELLIKRGLDKAETMQKRAENVIKDKFNMLDFQVNTVNMYQFEDVDYLQEKRKEQEKALNENKLFPKFYQGGQIGVSSEAKKKKLLKI